MPALEDVAPEDEASGARFHRLARLLEHGFITGLLDAGNEQQRPVGRPDQGLDGFLRRELPAVRLRYPSLLAWLGEIHLDQVGPSQQAVETLGAYAGVPV